jgi:formate C-acetyltransferase
MSAIEKVVFQERACTMDQLLSALRDNWDGWHDLRQKCIDAPKYGTDNDFADNWSKYIADVLMDSFESHPTARGGKFICGFMSVTQNHVLGDDTDATPDGRKAGEPLSDSISPSLYAVAVGPTATHRSATKAIDTSRTVHGITFAQNLDLSFLKTDRELSKWKSLLMTYFEDGGMSVQYNITSGEDLIEAQKSPEKHKDLFIRIGGYTARFVELSKAMQDTLIKKSVQRI